MTLKDFLGKMFCEHRKRWRRRKAFKTIREIDLLITELESLESRQAENALTAAREGNEGFYQPPHIFAHRYQAHAEQVAVLIEKMQEKTDEAKHLLRRG